MAAALAALGSLITLFAAGIEIDLTFAPRVAGTLQVETVLAAVGSALGLLGWAGACRAFAAGTVDWGRLRGAAIVLAAGAAVLAVSAVFRWVTLRDGRYPDAYRAADTLSLLATIVVAAAFGLGAAAAFRSPPERRRGICWALLSVAGGYLFGLVSAVAFAGYYDQYQVSGSLVPGFYVEAAGTLVFSAGLALLGLAFRERRPAWLGRSARLSREELVVRAAVVAAAGSVLVGIGEGMVASSLAGLGYAGEASTAGWLRAVSRLAIAAAFAALARAAHSAVAARRAGAAQQ